MRASFGAFRAANSLTRWLPLLLATRVCQFSLFISVASGVARNRKANLQLSGSRSRPRCNRLQSSSGALYSSISCDKLFETMAPAASGHPSVSVLVLHRTCLWSCQEPKRKAAAKRSCYDVQAKVRIVTWLSHASPTLSSTELDRLLLQSKRPRPGLTIDDCFAPETYSGSCS